MRVELFDFELPQGLIAQRPAVPRDSARLLHLPRDGEPAEHVVTDLPSLLRPGDLLVFNDTRVIPARLYGTRATGGKVEALLLHPPDAGVWQALVRGSARLRLEEKIAFEGGLSATITGIDCDGTVDLDFGSEGERVLGMWP